MNLENVLREYALYVDRSDDNESILSQMSIKEMVTYIVELGNIMNLYDNPIDYLKSYLEDRPNDLEKYITNLPSTIDLEGENGLASDEELREMILLQECLDQAMREDNRFARYYEIVSDKVENIRQDILLLDLIKAKDFAIVSNLARTLPSRGAHTPLRTPRTPAPPDGYYLEASPEEPLPEDEELGFFATIWKFFANMFSTDEGYEPRREWD